MKRNFIIGFFIMIFFSSIISISYAAKKNQYGQAISETKVTAIGDILANPQQFQDKSVLIEGKITEECPSGGWVMLKDNTATIFVDFHPSDFAIPQRVGKKAVAEGVVKKEGYRIEMIGTGVELK